MTRMIFEHQVNQANDQLVIKVLDEKGSGGANHEYAIELQGQTIDSPAKALTTLHFQNGPIKENGVNGVTHEVLLAILCDRLRGFQSGKFACRENALALTKLEEAQFWLQSRTRQREARGVEGTHTV